MVSGSELEMVKIRYPLKGVKVGAIALRDLRYVSESITLAQFLESVAVPQQRFYPTVNSANNKTGVLDMKDIKIQHQFYIDSIQSFRFTNLSYSYFKIFIILNHISLSQADLCQY